MPKLSQLQLDDVRAKIEEAKSRLISGVAPTNSKDGIVCCSELVMLHQKLGARQETFNWCIALLGHTEAKRFLSGPSYASFNYMAAIGYESNDFDIATDMQKALKYYEEAAKFGDPYSQYRLGQYYEEVVVVEDSSHAAVRAEAFKYYSMSAQYLPEAEFAVARCYKNGVGEKKDTRKAYGLLEKLAPRYAPAYYELALYYFAEDDVSSFALGHLTALEYLQKAAEMGVVNAQYDLGLFLLNHSKSEEKLKKAFSWLKCAANHQEEAHPFAKWYVAHCLHLGLGCKRDDKLSDEYAASAHKLLADRLQVLPNDDEAHYFLQRKIGINEEQYKTEVCKYWSSQEPFVKSTYNDKIIYEDLTAIWLRSIRRPNSLKMSPLHLHAINGKVEELKKVMEVATISIGAEDAYGHTALEYAVAFGRLICAGELLDNGAASLDDIKDQRELFRALVLAVASDQESMVRLLALHKYFNPAMVTANEGDSLFHIAAKFNSYKTLLFLYSISKLRTLDPSVLNNNGDAAIHIAALCGNDRILSYLLTLGADINALNSKHETALVCAIRNDKEEIVKLLVANGARTITQVEIKGIAKSDTAEKYSNLMEAYKRKQHKDQKEQSPSRQQLQNKRNLILNGGGVRGIGHIGVLSQLEKQEGKVFFERLRRIAGTSAGAINAFGIAIGFAPADMYRLLGNTNLSTQFMDSDNRELVATLIKIAGEGMTLERLFNVVTKELSSSAKLASRAIKKGIASYKGFASGGIIGTFRGVADALASAAYGYVLCDMAYDDVKILAGGLIHGWNIFSAINRDYGIFPGHKAVEFLEDMLVQRGLDKDLTFADLAKKHAEDPRQYKLLYVVAVNLTKMRTEVLSHEYEQTKNVRIVDAVLASMSIPFFFKPHFLKCKGDDGSIKEFSDDLYIDGGILMNYPINIFDSMKYQHSDGDLSSPPGDNDYVFNEQTLGFYLSDKFTVNQHSSATFNNDSSDISEAGEIGALNYAKKLLSLYMHHEDDLLAQGNNYKRTVFVPSMGVSIVDFALTEKDQEMLYNAGRTACFDFLEKSLALSSPLVLSSSFRNTLLRFTSPGPVELTSRGLEIHQLKLTICTAEQLYQLLCAIESTQDLQFFSQLPIDIHCQEPESKKTVWHYAFDKLDTAHDIWEKDEPEKVVDRLFFLMRQNLFPLMDLNIQDSKGRSILALIMRSEHYKKVHEQWLLSTNLELPVFEISPRKVDAKARESDMSCVMPANVQTKAGEGDKEKGRASTEYQVKLSQSQHSLFGASSDGAGVASSAPAAAVTPEPDLLQ